MPWVQLGLALLKIVGAITDYLERRQMLDAGRALEFRQATEEINARIAKARAVVAELDVNPDGPLARLVRERYRQPTTG